MYIEGSFTLHRKTS